jgi:arginyl-tRNA synthetase
VVALAARRVEPDAVVAHARHLAAAFHRYYNRGRFLDGDPGMVRARITLARGVARVLAASLDLVGAAGPEQG